jgi:dephospho-CoA kinase
MPILFRHREADLSAKHSLTIALTGGIASGKSTVSQYFVRLGVPVFDADVMARDLVAPDQPALKEIVTAFGNDTLTSSGTLDRHAMRERIFADPSARLALEKILHPRIREGLIAQASECSAPYCILAIPLFAEHRDEYRWIGRVLVVDARQETQLARLMQRDEMTMNSARMALEAQATRAQRLALATDVIDNDGELADVAASVARLNRHYRCVAENRAVKRD